VDQNVAVPTVFDSLRRVPFAARVVFDILQRPDYVAPRQSCNNLLHKWPVQVGLRERARVLNTRYVCDLARYYRRSPELISYEQVTGWLYHLIKERQLSASSVNIAVSAVRFLYAVTLDRETLELMASIRHMKRATRRAEVYARSEVEAILTAPRQPRDRVLLMTVYGCGLRISEAAQLKTSDIDRDRMQLRVRDGKGAKGRVLAQKTSSMRHFQVSVVLGR
jgi:integrase/recombinase XerD